MVINVQTKEDLKLLLLTKDRSRQVVEAKMYIIYNIYKHKSRKFSMNYVAQVMGVNHSVLSYYINTLLYNEILNNVITNNYKDKINNLAIEEFITDLNKNYYYYRYEKLYVNKKEHKIKKEYECLEDKTIIIKYDNDIKKFKGYILENNNSYHIAKSPIYAVKKLIDLLQQQ